MGCGVWGVGASLGFCEAGLGLVVGVGGSRIGLGVRGFGLVASGCEVLRCGVWWLTDAGDREAKELGLVHLI